MGPAKNKNILGFMTTALDISHQRHPHFELVALRRLLLVILCLSLFLSWTCAVFLEAVAQLLFCALLLKIAIIGLSTKVLIMKALGLSLS